MSTNKEELIKSIDYDIGQIEMLAHLAEVQAKVMKEYINHLDNLKKELETTDKPQNAPVWNRDICPDLVQKMISKLDNGEFPFYAGKMMSELYTLFQDHNVTYANFKNYLNRIPVNEETKRSYEINGYIIGFGEPGVVYIIEAKTKYVLYKFKFNAFENIITVLKYYDEKSWLVGTVNHGELIKDRTLREICVELKRMFDAGEFDDVRDELSPVLDGGVAIYAQYLKEKEADDNG